MTGRLAAWPTMSHRAMSTAAFAVGLPTVRFSFARTASRRVGAMPSSCGSKICRITVTMDCWVSP